MRARLAFGSLAAGVSAVIIAACGRTDLGPSAYGSAGGASGEGGADIVSSTSTSSLIASSSTSVASVGPGGSGAGGGLPGFCGDGALDPGEQCDDGNDAIDDACVFCAKATCGDGVVWAGVEQCDDGNKDNNDGCKNNCALNSCGNGVIEPGEQCDDGNFSNADACLSTCMTAKCGDGFVWAGVEQCDDANQNQNDGCHNDCKVGFCGDTIVDPGEQCDDGNFSNTDACVPNCLNAKCGDGVVWAGVEQCDDANQNQNDGCHNNCKLGACGDKIVDPGEQCDDGNFSNIDACVSNCMLAKCGDGFVQAGVEQCDDGNQIDGDGCSAACKLPICGDGNVDPGEACDLGANNANRPAFLLTQGAIARGVRPVDRNVVASIFYGYSSASSHTGYEDINASRVFLYRDLTTGVLSLFFHHGIDFNSSGLNQPPAQAALAIQNLPVGVSVALADDTPGEFFLNSPTSAKGDWKFQNNSDGGVLTGLPIPGNWSINITPTFSFSMKSWAYVDGDDSLQALGLVQTATLKAFNTPAACRLDCTAPACGDGILDGGEVCDDGNTQAGDGCSADCKSLE